MNAKRIFLALALVVLCIFGSANSDAQVRVVVGGRPHPHYRHHPRPYYHGGYHRGPVYHRGPGYRGGYRGHRGGYHRHYGHR